MPTRIRRRRTRERTVVQAPADRRAAWALSRTIIRLRLRALFAGPLPAAEQAQLARLRDEQRAYEEIERQRRLTEELR